MDGNKVGVFHISNLIKEYFVVVVFHLFQMFLRVLLVLLRLLFILVIVFILCHDLVHFIKLEVLTLDFRITSDFSHC